MSFILNLTLSRIGNILQNFAESSASRAEEDHEQLRLIGTVAIGVLVGLGCLWHFQRQRTNLLNSCIHQITRMHGHIYAYIVRNPLNPLTSFPHSASCPHLQVLDLAMNRLTAPLDLTHNTQLQWLNLSRNRLEIVPNLTANTRLRQLDLSHNRLSTLPDFILNLPIDCRVFLTGNHFSSDYVTQFRERVSQHRLQHIDQGPSLFFFEETSLDLPNLNLHLFEFPFPTEPELEPEPEPLSLKQEMDSWVKELQLGQEAPTFTSLLTLDTEAQKTLCGYLRRLRGVEDYTKGGASRQQIIERANKLLHLANRNETFRNSMLALINEGLETCGDRVLIIFNDLEILHQFYEKQLEEPKFKNLCIRASRYEELKKHAKKLYREKSLEDEIETILYFHLKLKKDLDLPISTENMIFPSLSGVTEKMLKEAKEKISSLSIETLLSRSDYWQAYIGKEQEKLVSEINNRYAELLVNLEGYFASRKDSKEERDLPKDSPLEIFLERAEQKRVPFEYSQMARFLDEERKQEIARLPSTKK